MQTKNKLKIMIDLILVILLSLMFRTMGLGLTFHEIGGLVLIALAILHLILNTSWLSTMYHRITTSATPFRVKLGLIIDILLVLSFLLIGISGIFISRIIFNLQFLQSVPWQIIHYTSSALALLFVGIHLGLHAPYLVGIAKRISPLKGSVGKKCGLVISMIILAFGIYSLTSTNYLRMLTMPFQSQANMGHGMGKRNFNGQQPPNAGNNANGQGNGQNNGTGNGQGNGAGFGNGQRPDNFQGKGRGGKQSIQPATALLTVANYISITFLFAAITAITCRLTKKKETTPSP